MSQELPPIQDMVSFRCLDSYLDTHKKDTDTFKMLFEKKQKLITLIQERKLTSKVYKGILVKKYKQSEKYQHCLSSADIKSLIEMDLVSLQDLNDGDVDAWFEDCVNETGDAFEQQQTLYQKYLNPSPKKTQPSKQKQPHHL